eukprot:6195127-Prymnesium_polylepis.1
MTRHRPGAVDPRASCSALGFPRARLDALKPQFQQRLKRFCRLVLVLQRLGALAAHGEHHLVLRHALRAPRRPVTPRVGAAPRRLARGRQRLRRRRARHVPRRHPRRRPAAPEPIHERRPGRSHREDRHARGWAVAPPRAGPRAWP